MKGNENSNPATRVSGVLNWSLFSLLNTVFNLQHRKPFFYNLIISIKSLLQMNNRIAGSIDRITGEFIKTKINQSITRDKVARIINDLRSKPILPVTGRSRPSRYRQKNKRQLIF